MVASSIGEPNDTVVIILPKITELGIVGDYRRPDPNHFTSGLNLKQGMVEGLIKGDVIAPPEYNILSIDYDEFKTKIIEYGDCSAIVLNTNDAQEALIINANNPFNSFLNIRLNDVVRN